MAEEVRLVAVAVQQQPQAVEVAAARVHLAAVVAERRAAAAPPAAVADEDDNLLCMTCSSNLNAFVLEWAELSGFPKAFKRGLFKRGDARSW